MVRALIREPSVFWGLVLVATGVLLGHVLSRRTARPWRAITSWSLAATGGVLVVTLLPVGAGPHHPTWGLCVDSLLSPQLALSGPEPVANVLLFLVPACLWTLATHRPGAVLLGAVAFSWAVEMLQASGIPHSCAGNDLAHNTLGAAIGVGIAAVVLRLIPAVTRARLTLDQP